MLTIQLLQLVQPGSDIVKRRRDHIHGENEDSNISVKQVNENIKKNIIKYTAFKPYIYFDVVPFKPCI